MGGIRYTGNEAVYVVGTISKIFSFGLDLSDGARHVVNSRIDTSF